MRPTSLYFPPEEQNLLPWQHKQLPYNIHCYGKQLSILKQNSRKFYEIFKKKKKAKNEGNFSYLLTWDVSNLPKAEPALLLQFMLSDSKTCQVLIYWLEWYPLGPLEQLLMIREMPAKENLAAFLLGAANADELCPQWWRAPHCQDLWLEYQARFLLSLLLPRYVNPITREGNWYKHEVRGRVGRKFHQGAKQRGK